MDKKKPEDLIYFAAQQIGQPYCWGGNGETVYALIRKFASGKGQSKENTDKMLEFMSKNGCKDMRFYDCSGMIVYFLMNNGLLDHDVTADELYRMSKKTPIPVDGCLAFLLRDNGTAYHVGVVDADSVIQAHSQSKGVIREDINKRGWVYALPDFAIDYTDPDKIDFKVGDLITTKDTVRVYTCEDEAERPLSTSAFLNYPPRDYFIYKKTGKCVNISRRIGIPGGWLTMAKLKEVI